MADEEERSRLDPKQREEVDERKSGSSVITHEVIREEGEEELDRPAMSLLFSALVAGVAMNASVLAKTYMRADLPDVPWRELVEAAGYTLGFLIVVLGRMQLFTESTVTAVLPVAARPGWAKLGKLVRLWSIVFVTNMAGTLLVAWALADSALLSPPQFHALMEVSHEAIDQTPWRILLLGIPSGFLVGAIAWMLPNNREGGAFWVVFSLTYLIGLGGFSHVVAGATEAWLPWLKGETSFLQAAGGVVLPSLVGNILGGTFLFAFLAHGQVRHELGGG